MQRNIQQVCNASLISIWLCIFKFTLQHLISLESKNDEFIKMALTYLEFVFSKDAV